MWGKECGVNKRERLRALSVPDSRSNTESR